MTTQSRIAAFLSTSALCLGLAAAPSAFAAPADATPGATAHTKTHASKHHAKKTGTHAHAKAKTSAASVK
ncbi:hypothetical protein CEK29_06560 [Bordetella genomosp. 5]|uniref:Acid-shock protein n=1 Tax=Bordetella genomosp. 5 TaxID=1395608 RepID=A0A261TM33_9BORD|nr:hypothetical protein [Bordetella genomosp. 5]OZI44394.1 hypothetical protein CEK29_06560 [Bordetella genomosp. 5]OZI50252.1 hypothetical protein CAL25_13095 [Bordetella genomosp. 5]